MMFDGNIGGLTVFKGVCFGVCWGILVDIGVEWCLMVTLEV